MHLAVLAGDFLPDSHSASRGSGLYCDKIRPHEYTKY